MDTQLPTTQPSQPIAAAPAPPVQPTQPAQPIQPLDAPVGQSIPSDMAAPAAVDDMQRRTVVEFIKSSMFVAPNTVDRLRQIYKYFDDMTDDQIRQTVRDHALYLFELYESDVTNHRHYWTVLDRFALLALILNGAFGDATMRRAQCDLRSYEYIMARMKKSERLTFEALPAFLKFFTSNFDETPAQFRERIESTFGMYSERSLLIHSLLVRVVMSFAIVYNVHKTRFGEDTVYVTQTSPEDFQAYRAYLMNPQMKFVNGMFLEIFLQQYDENVRTAGESLVVMDRLAIFLSAFETLAAEIKELDRLQEELCGKLEEGVQASLTEQDSLDRSVKQASIEQTNSAIFANADDGAAPPPPVEQVPYQQQPPMDDGHRRHRHKSRKHRGDRVSHQQQQQQQQPVNPQQQQPVYQQQPQQPQPSIQPQPAYQQPMQQPVQPIQQSVQRQFQTQMQPMQPQQQQQQQLHPYQYGDPAFMQYRQDGGGDPREHRRRHKQQQPRDAHDAHDSEYSGSSSGSEDDDDSASYSESDSYDDGDDYSGQYADQQQRRAPVPRGVRSRPVATGPNTGVYQVDQVYNPY